MGEGGRERLRALTPEQRRKLAARLRGRSGAPGPIVPVSAATERFWFLENLQPGHPAHLVRGWIRIEGAPDLALLQQAIDTVRELHPALRMRLLASGDTVQGRIDPPRPLPLDVVALSSGEDVEARVIEVGDRLSARPFELASEHAARFAAVRVDESETVLVFVIHHALADGSSLQLLFDALTQAYRVGHEGVAGMATPFSDPGTIAARRRRWLDSAEARRQLARWCEILEGAPAMELPLDRPRRGEPGRHGARLSARWSSERVDALFAVGRTTGATPFMVFAALLVGAHAVRAGQDDVVIGTPWSGREDAEASRVFGAWINSVVLRVAVDREAGFDALLERMKAVATESFGLGRVPFERIVDRLDLPRSLDRNPLFSVMLNFGDAFDPQVRVGDTTWTAGLDPRGSLLDATLYVRIDDSGATLTFEYDTDLFFPATITRWLDDLAGLADAVVANVGTSPVEALHADGRGFLVHGPRDADVVPPSLPDALRESCLAMPTGVAWTDGQETIARGEILARAEHLARRLVSDGVRVGDLVGVDLERGAELPVVLLAIQLAGAGWVALDQRWPLSRRRSCLATGVRRVLVADDRRDAWAEEGVLVRSLDALANGSPERSAREVSLPAPDPDRIAYVLHTSGSSGRPKAIAVSHRALVNFLRAVVREPGFGPEDRLLATTTIGFDIAQLELFAPVLAGASVTVVTEDLASEAEAVVTRLSDAHVTVLQTTPSTWRHLRASGARGREGLRILLGGERLPRDLAARTLEEGSVLWNLYGPTETTVWSSATPIEPGDAITIGRPLLETTLVVADEKGRPLPAGHVGELWIGGRGVAQGYLGDEDETARRFRTLEACPERGRMHRTGDRARFDGADRLVFLGRTDAQVKVRGHRIETEEVALALRTHPAVRDAHVGVAAMAGDGVEELTAWVRPVDGIETVDWSAVWTQTYAEPGEDPAFDLAGWVASRGAPDLDADVLRAWRDATLERIRNLHPRRVLELGTGTGLLLWPLAREVERYFGVELVPEMAARVAARAREEGLDHVAILAGDLRNVRLPEEERFDCVILNSVTQYLADAVEVGALLDRLEPWLSPGASVFFGDVRDQDRAQRFHGERLDAEGVPRAARERLATIAARMRAERELCLAPRWWVRLVADRPAWSLEALAAKATDGEDELTRFRYDVSLAFGVEAGRASSGSDDVVVHEPADGEVLEGLLEEVACGPDATHVLLGVPDARMTGGEDAGAFDPPRVMRQLAARGLPFHLGPSLVTPGRLDLVIAPVEEGERVRPWWPSVDIADEPGLTSQPARALADMEVLAGLRDHLLQQLPEVHVPTRWMAVDEFPRGAGGKIDPAALPRPSRTHRGGAADDASDPRIPIIAEAIAGVLGLASVGAEDDFFALGGHSLLATRLAHRLEESLGFPVPLRAIFRAPTARGLAATLGVDADRDARAASHRIPALGADDPQPVSFAEERLLVLEALGTGDARYAMPLAARLTGTIDRSRWNAAVAALVARHPVLRTSYPSEKGRPAWRQVATAAADIVWHEAEDVSEASEELWLREVIRAPFRPTIEPAWRVAVRSAGDRHVLVLVFHHLLADARSLAVIARDLTVLLRGEAEALDEPASSVAAFAAWQRTRIETDAAREALGWWRARLHGWPSSIVWPRGPGEPHAGPGAGGLVSLPIEQDLLTRVGAFARARATTPFSVWLAALTGLHERILGTDRVLLGTTLEERIDPRLDDVVGLFANLVVLRMKLDARCSFEDLVAQAGQEVREALGQGATPFERLVSALALERDLARPPLVQLTFDEVHLPSWPARIDDLVVEPLQAHPGTARFELSWRLVHAPAGASLEVEFQRGRFDGAIIHDWMKEVVRMLAQGIATPERPLAPPVSLIAGRCKADDRSTPLPEALALRRAAHAERCALVDPHGVRHDHVALELAVQAWREGLRQAGVRAGERVGLALPRGLDLAAAWLAIWEEGAVVVPFDPGHACGRIGALLARAGVRRWVAEDSLHAAVQKVHAVASVRRGEGPQRPLHAVGVEDPAYLLFTSGSTGEPEGIVVPHGAIAFYVRHAVATYPYDAGGPAVWHTSSAADLTLTSWLPALLAGEPVRQAGEGDGIEPLLELLEDGVRASVLKLTPSHLRALARSGRTTGLAAALVVGGEALEGATLAPFVRDGAPRIFNEYGPTEATVGCIVHEVLDAGDAGAVPIGRPWPGVEVAVTDGHGRPVPGGVPGMLSIGGPGLALGRLDVGGELLPLEDESGWYGSGDRIWRGADGAWRFLERGDDQLSVRGTRVAPGEVETLLRSVPGVDDGVVLPESLDDGGTRLVAHIQGTIDVALVRERLTEALHPAAVPTRWVTHTSWPRTPSGKTDRVALASMRDVGLATLDEPGDASVVTRIARVFETVLGSGPVGPHDPFFTVGGDSILALEVAARLRDAGLAITPRDLFRHGSPASLARLLAERASEVRDGAGHEPVSTWAELPMARWWRRRIGGRGRRWNQDLILALAPELDREALLEGVRRWPERHVGLRTVRAPGDDPSVARVVPPEDAAILVERVAVSDADEVGRRRRELGQRIDLFDGPLLVAGLCEAADGRAWLVLAAHHVVIDARSWRVLLGDLIAGRDPSARDSEATEARVGAGIEKLARAWRTEASLEVVPRLPWPETADTSRPWTMTDVIDPVTEAPEVALTMALGRALAALLDVNEVAIDVEGHGRDADVPGARDREDLVAWCTVLRSVFVPGAGASWEEARDAVTEGLACSAEESLARFARRAASGSEHHDAEVTLNLLAGIAGGSGDAALMRPVAHDVEPIRDEAAERPWALEVDVVPEGARWRVVWRGDGRVPEPLRARLRQTFMRNLEASVQALAADARGCEAVHPLTATQAGMLHHAMLAPEDPAYHEQMAVELEGVFDVERFRRALAVVVQRHAALRGSVRPRRDGSFGWWVARQLEPEVQCETCASAAVRDRLGRDRAAGIDPHAAPPWRVLLLTLDDPRTLVVFTWHHLVLDGWSLMNVLRDLGQAYELGRIERAPPPTLHAAQLHAERLASGEVAREHWRERLNGIEEPTALPLAPRSDLVSRPEERECVLRLGKQRVTGMQARLRALGITPACLLQAAWGILLARHAGADDALFGMTVSGRGGDGQSAADAVGLFVNTIPRRVLIDAAAAPAAWLQAEQQRLEADLAFERTPLPVAQAASRVRAGSALFETLLVVENYPIDAALSGSLGGLRTVRTHGFERTSYALTLVFVPGDTWELRLLGDARWPGSRAARGLLGRLGHVMRSLLDEAVASMGVIEAAPPAETLRRLRFEGVVERDPPHLARMLASALEDHREQIAIEDGDTQVGHGTLLALAMRYAAVLQEGAPQQERMLALPERLDAAGLIALAGALLSRRPFVPVAREGDRLRHPELLAELRPLATADLAVGTSDLFDEVPAAALEGGTVEPLASSPDEPSADAIACVMPTSGTTGEPRPIAVSASALGFYARAAARAFPLRPGDRILQFASLAFDTALEEIVPAWLSGATVVTCPAEARESVVRFLHHVRALRITVLDLPTAWWHVVVAEMSASDRSAFEHVRLVILGGEAVDPARLEAWFACWPEDEEPPELRNTYGPTEATIVTAWTRLTREDAVDALPIGVPVPGTRLSVEDANGRSLPLGAVGELVVRGPNVARLWSPDGLQPLTDGGGLRTGDLVSWRADGRLAFHGRKDRMVKRRGRRVVLDAIERVLLTSDGVVDAAVGTGPDGRLVAWVVDLDPDRAAPDHALRALVREHLGTASEPSRIVRLERLPRTPGDKIDRARLRLPASGSYETATIEDENPLTRHLIEAFAEVLDLEHLPSDADFFDLGGDSLLAARLLTRIERVAGAVVPLTALFDHPTPKALAAAIAGEVDPPAAVDPEVPPLGDGWQPVRGEVKHPPRRVLLTGATGLLGTHLLVSLLEKEDPTEILALVRARDLREARDRLLAAVTVERPELLDASRHPDWIARFTARVRPVVGDLSAASLARADSDALKALHDVDTIVHAAADTSFMRSYRKLHPVNVGGTRDLLDLLTVGRPKVLHHVSTIGIFDATVDRPQVLDETTPFDHLRPAGAYARTKQDAERLVQAAIDRGARVIVHRPGRLVPEAPEARPDDLALRVFRGAVALGAAPDVDLLVEARRAREVAAAMVALMEEVAPAGTVHHLHDPDPIALRALARRPELTGGAIELCPPAEWLERAREACLADADHPLRAALPFLAGLELTRDVARVHPRIEARRTLARLEGLGITLRSWSESDA